MIGLRDILATGMICSKELILVGKVQEQGVRPFDIGGIENIEDKN